MRKSEAGKRKSFLLKSMIAVSLVGLNGLVTDIFLPHENVAYGAEKSKDSVDRLFRKHLRKMTPQEVIRFLSETDYQDLPSSEKAQVVSQLRDLLSQQGKMTKTFEHILLKESQRLEKTHVASNSFMRGAESQSSITPNKTSSYPYSASAEKNLIPHEQVPSLREANRNEHRILTKAPSSSLEHSLEKTENKLVEAAEFSESPLLSSQAEPKEEPASRGGYRPQEIAPIGEAKLPPLPRAEKMPLEPGAVAWLQKLSAQKMSPLEVIQNLNHPEIRVDFMRLKPMEREQVIARLRDLAVDTLKTSPDRSQEIVSQLHQLVAQSEQARLLYHYEAHHAKDVANTSEGALRSAGGEGAHGALRASQIKERDRFLDEHFNNYHEVKFYTDLAKPSSVGNQALMALSPAVQLMIVSNLPALTREFPKVEDKQKVLLAIHALREQVIKGLVKADIEKAAAKVPLTEVAAHNKDHVAVFQAQLKKKFANLDAVKKDEYRGQITQIKMEHLNHVKALHAQLDGHVQAMHDYMLHLLPSETHFGLLNHEEHEKHMATLQEIRNLHQQIGEHLHEHVAPQILAEIHTKIIPHLHERTATLPEGSHKVQLQQQHQALQEAIAHHTNIVLHHNEVHLPH